MSVSVPLPFGGDAWLLVLVALTTSGFFLCGLAGLGNGRHQLKRRVSAVRASATASRTASSAVSSSASLRRRERSAVGAVALTRMVSLLPRISSLQVRLNRAGFNLAAPDLLVICLVVVLLGAGVAYLVLNVALPLAIALGILLGTALPHLVIDWRIKRRLRCFVLSFPDVIDLIVRGVRSGLPVTESIQAAGREGDSVIAGVFAEVAGNLQLGMSLEESLWVVARRLDLQEFKFFVISLSIQQETGGNLAEILSNLSHMMRRREQVKMKIRAMSSEAKASAMIIGSLPFIMMALLYFVNPQYISILFINPKGWLLLSAGATSMIIGIVVMAKMVRFEI